MMFSRQLLPDILLPGVIAAVLLPAMPGSSSQAAEPASVSPATLQGEEKPAAPPTEPSTAGTEDEVVSERRRTSVRSGRQLRAAYIEIVRATARRAEYDPLEVAPTALRLFIELVQAEDISHAERSRMQSRLKVRLSQLRDRLIRDQKRRERDGVSTTPVDAEAPVVRRTAAGQEQSDSAETSRKSSLPGGGNGEAARALELIELIENTIAPDTWDSRGGRGTIRYFSLLRVLVVRQTGEVHHQLGGALNVLRD